MIEKDLSGLAEALGTSALFAAVGMAIGIGKTEAEIDDLFALAVTL